MSCSTHPPHLIIVEGMRRGSEQIRTFIREKFRTFRANPLPSIVYQTNGRLEENEEKSHPKSQGEVETPLCFQTLSDTGNLKH